jgi:alpha-ketoglutarate-dependent taurine dioxygenase
MAPQPNKLAAPKRKLIRLSPADLVQTELPKPGDGLPVVIRPAVEGLDLIAWSEGNPAVIEKFLTQYGAILFRDFTIAGISAFENLIETVSGGLLDYTYRSTPRKHVSGRIYTSTEYPADQFIPLHNELSYSTAWPMKIWFYCVRPSDSGGETPIADSRKVFAAIDPAVRDRFARARIMYVRNYGNGLDLPWQDVFQTTSRTTAEFACRNAGVEFEWKDGDRLRTRQVCQAVAKHPKTGESVWFNQAHLFHVSRMKSDVRKSLLSAVAEEDLPRNVYYGDGSPIENSVLEHICAAYEQKTVVFHWKRGDILMLDNMLAAHGRRPFTGERKVVVGMAETVQQ